MDRGIHNLFSIRRIRPGLGGRSLSAICVWTFLLTAAVLPRQAPASEPEGLDAGRAYRYLQQICRIGPRYSGSRGMAEQQKLIAEHFTQCGAHVQFQSFDAEHPLTGKPVRMQNIIVSWRPKAKKRLLLACHYDTRPFPDSDKRNPRGIFLGANDGASGVALFMELAHHLPKLESEYGIDFVFFDGEELVYGNNGDYFLGSTYFSEQYRDNRPDYEYDFGILVDMVADRNLNLYKEKNSVKYAPKLTESIWETARSLGVREFIGGRPRYNVRDDHIPLNEIAKIPTCDIIDFDYPHWHTTRDTPAACSGASLVKVGRVLMAWLAAQRI